MKLSNFLIVAASLFAAPILAKTPKEKYIMKDPCTPEREGLRSCCTLIFQQLHYTRPEHHKAKTDNRLVSRTANNQELHLLVECKQKKWIVVDDCFFKPCTLQIPRL
jgi:hypothetical protein